MPTNPIFHIVVYILSFVGVWIGSGLAIKSVERLARIMKLSSFAVSFIVLGFFTSISELSVGINSILRDDPEIFVGNLIGASIVITMMIVPLLAIVGHKISITPELRGFNLRASLVVISLPVILALDGKIGKLDSFVALLLFGLLIVSVQRKKGILEKIRGINARATIKVGKELLRTLFGVVTIFIASRFIVEQTIYFSETLEVSPFLISLLFIAIGTNIPELSFIVRSAFMKSNQIVFGDYVGSAAFNTFLLGGLTLIYGKPVLLTNSYLVSLLFLILGLLLFYYFARTKNSISRLEGLILLFVYFLFVITEVFIHKESLLSVF